MESKLDKIAAKVVNNLREVLTKKGINATGHLSSSITYAVAPYCISITIPQYGEFVDKGTKPHMPPVDEINKWISAKGLKLNAWAVAKGIEKRGTKAKPWISEFKKTMMNLDEDVLQYMGIIIDKDFDKQFNKIWQ